MYRHAISLKPNYAHAHSNLAAVLKDLGRIEEVVKHYLIALQIDPCFTDACSNLGNVYKEQGQLDDAIAMYERALQINARYAIAHGNLANCLKDKGVLLGWRPCSALAGYWCVIFEPLLRRIGRLVSRTPKHLLCEIASSPRHHILVGSSNRQILHTSMASTAGLRGTALALQNGPRHPRRSTVFPIQEGVPGARIETRSKWD